MSKIAVFQRNLKKIRAFAEIEQRELASAVGVTRQTINNVETLKTSLTEPLYRKIVTHLKELALEGSHTIAPFIEFLLRIEDKKKSWGELSMRYRFDMLIREIKRMKEAGLNKEMQAFIHKKKGVSCKSYAFSYNLWNQLIRTSSIIFENLDDLQAVSRYYLKPLIEDYINLFNLSAYRKDYVRAMQIHFLTEDIQGINQHHDTLFHFGIATDSDPDAMAISRAKHYGRINEEIVRNALRSPERSPESYYLPMSSRMYLYKRAEKEFDEVEFSKLIEGLYDIANNHGHLNLRFLRKSSQNPDTFSIALLSLMERMLTETTVFMLKRFGKGPLKKEFTAFVETLETDEFIFIFESDYDDEEDEDDMIDPTEEKFVRITIDADYETPDRAGASGFQVIRVYGFDEDDNRYDLTKNIDQGYIYQDGRKVLEDLGLDPDLDYDFD